MRLKLVDMNRKLQAELDMPEAFAAPEAAYRMRRIWIRDVEARGLSADVYREVVGWPPSPAEDEEKYGPWPMQTEWWKLREKHGEKGMYLELARRLRQAADHLNKLAEHVGWPDVFGCDYPASEPMCSEPATTRSRSSSRCSVSFYCQTNFASGR